MKLEDVRHRCRPYKEAAWSRRGHRIGSPETRFSPVLGQDLTCQPQAEDHKFLMCKAVGLSLRSPFYFKILSFYVHPQTSQVALMVKNRLSMQVDVRDPGSIPGSGRSPGEGHGNPLQYAWRISWTEKPDGLQPIGSQRIRHNRSSLACTHVNLQESDECSPSDMERRVLTQGCSRRQYVLSREADLQRGGSGLGQLPMAALTNSVTEMYSLPVLEATSPKSRCLQDHTPSSGSGESSVLASNQLLEAVHIP